jgi:hypothetical protein
MMASRGHNIQEVHDKIPYSSIWLHVQLVGLNVISTQIFETIKKTLLMYFLNIHTSK